MKRDSLEAVVVSCVGTPVRGFRNSPCMNGKIALIMLVTG